MRQAEITLPGSVRIESLQGIGPARSASVILTGSREDLVLALAILAAEALSRRDEIQRYGKQWDRRENQGGGE